MTVTAARSADGRAVPAVQVTGQVFDVRRIGGFVELTIVAEGIPDRARPGSFVAIRGDGAPGGALLPRLMWVRRVRPTDRYGGTFDVVFEVRGPVTAWLASRVRHDPLGLVGPLGRPFPLPRQPVAALLTGLSHGTAPLLFLAEHLLQRRCEVHLAVGGGDGGEAFGVVDAKRVASSITSLDVGPTYGDAPGDRVLQTALERVAADRRARVVYACGTADFTRVAAAAAAAVGARSQVAIETTMPCGTGMCLACAVAVHDRAGESDVVRACVDGPVFDGDSVRWDQLTAAQPTTAASSR